MNSQSKQQMQPQTVFGTQPCLAGALALVAAVSLAAAGKESSSRPLPENVDYRHIHRKPAEWLFHGEPAKAADWCARFLKANPKDAEGWYFYAGALADLGRIDEAMEAVKRAEALGLPLARFIAGPREVFRPLIDSKAFRARAAGKPIRLVHGPLLGDVTDRSARIWVRTAKAARVSVLARPEGKTAAPARAFAVSSPETDYTAVAMLRGLAPRTSYRYVVEIGGEGGELPVASGRFATRPPPGEPTKVRFAFGGGAAYKPDKERMWSVILSHRPDAFLFLGDNVYIDAPRDPAYQRYKYYRRQSRPEFRAFTALVPIYAIYDDHDFGVNDCSGGPDVDRPAWKRRAWRVFAQNWANPSYGGGEARPGCWFRFQIGDVEFFLIDGRYYRTDPKKTSEAERSMLGPAQKRWLLEGLRRSRARIKVLASDVPWARGTKPGSLDTWDGFARERAEIFRFLAEHKIGGVILLSADRHRHDIWRVQWPGSYPLYEFESSKLTNVHTHPRMKRALFSWNGNGFGLFDIDTTQPDPLIRYRIVSIDNKIVHEFSLRLSKLTP